MSAMDSQITGVSIVCSTVCSGVCSKLRVTGLWEGNPPMDYSRKGPVTRKMFKFDDVIMIHVLQMKAL